MTDKPAVRLKKENKQEGGRLVENAFGDEPGSVLHNLTFLPEEVRARYWKNRKTYKGDTTAMDSWASQGCTSMAVEEFESNG